MFSLKNILFGFFAVFLGLFSIVIFVEIFFGILSWHDNVIDPKVRMGITATQFDSELGWALIKNADYKFNGKKITINSSGLRSPEIDTSKEHILVLGDSLAFGYGLSDKETFSHFLEKRLHSKYKNIQVLNLGVSGYGVDQYYLFLKRHIENLNPKIIIVLICSRNDLLDTST